MTRVGKLARRLFKKRRHTGATRDRCLQFVSTVASSLAILSISAAGPVGAAAPLVNETFSANPIASGRASVAGDAARFTQQAGGLVAHYDTGLSTTKLIWPLGTTLDQNDSFELEAVFTIQSANFFAKVNDFSQLSFGLLNSITTGSNRTGGDTYDFVGVDYFPSSTTVPSWNVPALGPVAIQSNNGTSFFGRIEYPFGAESGIKLEGALPLDSKLTATLAYDADLRLLTLSMRAGTTPLDINSSGDLGDYGGFDGDISTIQLYLPLDVTFAVDRLALPLWSAPAVGGGTAVRADLLFDNLRIDLASLSPGDANDDGFVDGADYTIWADHFLQSQQTFFSGDFSGDGLVDSADYTIWADHFAPASLAVAPVPEPSTKLLATVALLLMGAVAWSRRRSERIAAV